MWGKCVAEANSHFGHLFASYILSGCGRNVEPVVFCKSDGITREVGGVEVTVQVSPQKRQAIKVFLRTLVTA